MPALTLRGRYLMREYWADSDLFKKLSADEREFYMGLWMLADDHGWMPRNITEIAAALYRFEDVAAREARVRSSLDRLKAMGKLQSLRCGCLFLPVVVKYPRPGKKSDEHARAHAAHSNAMRQPPSNGFEPHSNPSPNPSRPSPSQPVPGAQAQEEETTTADEPVSEFRRLVPLPPGIGGGRPS